MSNKLGESKVKLRLENRQESYSLAKVAFLCTVQEYLVILGFVEWS